MVLESDFADCGDIFFPSHLKKFLLSYNLHTIQFTCFTCTIQWFLVHLQICVTITTGIDLSVRKITEKLGLVISTLTVTNSLNFLFSPSNYFQGTV